ncbi:helix-turn-helix domain-containing protein [Allokutzneria oryzae]|uniref:Helix-turn-helix domain-containing protein n=1 Tax=Allokutzneria oryzae TaxID=1378989 RepID=A0ABV5ZTR1_9PSEU
MIRLIDSAAAQPLPFSCDSIAVPRRFSLVLRIHFTRADIARTSFAASPDPLWETLLGLHALQSRGGPPMIDRWRRETDTDRMTRSLLLLAPPLGYSPDFLTPAEAAAGFDEGLEALVRTPVARRRAELARVVGGGAMPGWMRVLAERDDVFRDFGASLAAFHDCAIRSVWPRIELDFERDRTRRARTVLDGGIGAALSTLNPCLRWDGHVLEVGGEHVTGDLHLEGRGLRLIPSYFCVGFPTLLADPDLPPVLVYPIARTPVPGGEAARPELGALLGRTRAEVLRMIEHCCTTTELSAAVGLSVSTASYHAGALRKAGLVATVRTGTAVLHALTPLGRNLLAAYRSP